MGVTADAGDVGGVPQEARPGLLRRAPVPVLVGAGLAVFILGVAGALLGGADSTPGPTAMTVTLAVTFTPLGVFLVRRLPGHHLGPLMTLVGVTATVAALAVAWSVLLPAAWLSQWLWWVPVTTIPLILLLVPDGRLPSPRWRPLAGVLAAGGVTAALALATAALLLPRTLLSSFQQAEVPFARASALVAVGGVVAVVLGSGGVLVALVQRWRTAAALERGQLACLAPAAGLLIVGVVLDTTNVVPNGWLPAVVALPVGLTLAVLRYQFHDLDLYIHRGIVWLVLTAAAVGTYAVLVTALGAWLTGLSGTTASILAAGSVAALLQPAQRLAQRAVSRLLYGRRDEPYSVMTDLARQLGSVRDPLAVLPGIARTIVDGLRVPYAAVRVTGPDGTVTTAAEHGRWAGPPERFTMVAHGEPVGELLVAPRQVGVPFGTDEAAVLRDLAGQAALAAEACRAAVTLAAARDRLVLAREEERRRLRRDLHDGVASALVGTRMLAEVARRAVEADEQARALLVELAGDLDACTVEVRELIDGLRPAALDDGLEIALRGLVDRFAGQGPVITLAVGEDLAGLPAAVEVAAYRVIGEALTNVVKHAGAGSAEVRVRRDVRHLDVHIVDDGSGMIAARDGGVGLTSMRERAEELGGQLTVTSEGGGTDVALLLPLGA